MFEYFKEYFDFRGLVLCAALVAAGLISLYSATYDAGAAAIYQRQTYWVAAGFVAMMVAALFPFRTLQRLAIPTYVLSLLLLVAVLVFGKTISGSRSWFGFGAYGIQPSELVKVATVLALAAFLARSDVSLVRLRHLLVALGIVLIPVALILAQPDLGTALVFFAMLLPVLFWAGAPHFIVCALLAPVIVGAGALFGTTVFLVSIGVVGVMLYATHENKFALASIFGLMVAVGLSVQAVYARLPVYQQKRIATFINPESDPLGAGYNVIQAKVAIGSGGWAGKGYLQGTQTQLNFIPEQWTDFIFCVPGEEFGFIGASLILVLFGLFLFHGIGIASASKNPFSSIAAVGFVGIVATHLLINVGMSLGILPVIGLPLPFLSYGGSALLANMTMVGLLMNFYANRKEH